MTAVWIAAAIFAVGIAFVLGDQMGARRAEAEGLRRLRDLDREYHEHSAGMSRQFWKEMSELHQRHADQLANMASYGRIDGQKPAEVLDTAPPEDEVAIREMEMTAMTRYVQEQSPGISVEKAREEAARMLAVATGEGY